MGIINLENSIHTPGGSFIDDCFWKTDVLLFRSDTLTSDQDFFVAFLKSVIASGIDVFSEISSVSFKRGETGTEQVLVLDEEVKVK